MDIQALISEQEMADKLGITAQGLRQASRRRINLERILEVIIVDNKRMYDPAITEEIYNLYRKWNELRYRWDGPTWEEFKAVNTAWRKDM